MSNSWLKDNANGLITSVVIAAYLKFCMLPTATFFYEAYHLLKIEILYVGYQVSKVLGHVMTVWEHRNIASVSIGVFIFLVYLLVKKIRSRNTHVNEVA